MSKGKVLAIGVAVLLISSLSLTFFPESLESRPVTFSPLRVECVGDSITEGSRYPFYLQAMLGANCTVKNFGVGGCTVLLGAGKPYMNQTTFESALEFLPEIVIIMLGTNDARPTTYQYIEDFVNNYEQLIESFKRLASNPEIYLVKPPPIFNDDLGLSNANLVEGVIPGTEQVAKELGLPLIDVNTVLINHPEYFPDGVHPTNQGATVIASEIDTAITSKMSEM
jgi:acyl-CoA thioesterase-1